MVSISFRSHPAQQYLPLNRSFTGKLSTSGTFLGGMEAISFVGKGLKNRDCRGVGRGRLITGYISSSDQESEESLNSSNGLLSGVTLSGCSMCKVLRRCESLGDCELNTFAIVCSSGVRGPTSRTSEQTGGLGSVTGISTFRLGSELLLLPNQKPVGKGSLVDSSAARSKSSSGRSLSTLPWAENGRSKSSLWAMTHVSVLSSSPVTVASS